MSSNLEDVVRRLTEHGAELCDGGNSRAEIRRDLEGNITKAVHPDHHTQVMARVLDNLVLLPAWAALPEDSLIAPIDATPDSNVVPTPRSEVDELRETIRIMTEQLRRLSEAPQPATAPVATAVVDKGTMKLPDVGKFNGNRRAYRTFKSQMTDKLLWHGNNSVLGVAYIFNRLEGTAAHVGLSWKERNPQGSVEAFWSFLDEQYKDSLFEERSRQRLQTIMMKKSGQSLEAFNAEFIQLSYDAGEERNRQNLKT